MTKINCIIVDDEPLAIRLLTAHVKRIPELNLLASFENPTEALAFLRDHKVDLLLLDIQMPVITGLELARMLPATTQVIFTTAYRDFAVESYELEVVDYLVKPITFARFYQAVNKSMLLKPAMEPAHLRPTPDTVLLAPASDTSQIFRYVNVNKKRVKVRYEDITHVESLKDYIHIHTAAGPVVTREKISDFAAELPAYFLRTHRSFVVNSRRITAYTAHDVELGEVEVPIGASYKVAVMEALK